MLFPWLLAVPTLAMSHLAGTWPHTQAPAEQAAIEETRDRIAKRFNPMIRPAVRPRLKEVVAATPSYLIDTSAAPLVLLAWEGEEVRTRLGQEQKKGDRTIRLSTVDDGLELAVVGPNGTKTQRFVTDGDTLHVTITLASPRIGDPVTWELTYRQ